MPLPPPRVEDSDLRISAPLVAEISAHARSAYPHECCGVLVGRERVHTTVSSAHPAHNRCAPGSPDRYEMNPREIARLDREASHRGDTIVGFYHSHPDGPAEPSELDRALAWPGYIYLIVGAPGTTTPPVRAWRYNDAVGHFLEVPITTSLPSDAGDLRRSTEERMPDVSAS